MPGSATPLWGILFGAIGVGYFGGPVDAMPSGRAIGPLPGGQGRARKMYVDTSTSDDTAMRATGHGPKGCSAAARLAWRQQALGKRQAMVVPLVCGVALIVYPWFVSGAWLTLIVGVVLMAVPYFLRY